MTVQEFYINIKNCSQETFQNDYEKFCNKMPKQAKAKLNLLIEHFKSGLYIKEKDNPELLTFRIHKLLGDKKDLYDAKLANDIRVLFKVTSEVKETQYFKLITYYITLISWGTHTQLRIGAKIE